MAWEKNKTHTKKNTNNMNAFYTTHMTSDSTNMTIQKKRDTTKEADDTKQTKTTTNKQNTQTSMG